MNQDEFKQALIGIGFQIQEPYPLSGQTNLCRWIAYRKTTIDAPQCHCNEKPVQIVVEPHDSVFAPQLSANMELRACHAEDWFSIEAYGLKPEYLIANHVRIEAQLVAAWIAIATVSQ